MSLQPVTELDEAAMLGRTWHATPAWHPGEPHGYCGHQHMRSCTEVTAGIECADCIDAEHAGICLGCGCDIR